MTSKFTRIALSALAMVSATAVSAATVYNNGGPNQDSGNETTAWWQAEDFSFANDTTVTGAGVYLGGSQFWDGTFQYIIFANSGGLPGAALASGSANPTVSDSGVAWCCGGNAHLFEFNFGGAFNAMAGETYFLGIHASTDYARDEVYWVTTAPNATSRGVESLGGTFDNWVGNNQEHAFFLIDGTGGAVPEPATWALLILGFGALGGAMRRQTSLRPALSYS